MKTSIRSFLAVLISCLFVSNSISQNQVEFKQLFSYTYDPFYDFEYLSHDSSNVYYYRYHNKKQKIEIKSNNIQSGQLTHESKIKLPSQYSSSTVFKIGLVQKQICILSMFYNNKLKKHFLFRETFNPLTGLSHNDLKKFAEIPLMSKDFIWKFKSSEDKSKHVLLIYSYLKLKSLGSYMYVFDKDFNLLYEKYNIFDSLSGYNEIDNLIVSNDGKVFLLAKNYRTSEDAYKLRDFLFPLKGLSIFAVVIYIPEQNYDYFLLNIAEDIEPEACKFNPPTDKFIKYLSVFNTGNEIFFTGILSNKGNLNNAGVFVYKNHKNLPQEITITNTHEFTKEFQLQYLNEQDKKFYFKAMEKNENDIWDYHSHTNIGMVPFHDGFLMLIEQSLKTIYARSVKYQTYDEIGFNDYIYAINTDKDGEIKKVIKVPKKTSHIEKRLSNPDIQCSYKVVNGKLYLLFGDRDFKSPKVKNMILYIYDKELNRETIQIPMTEIFKNGLTTHNIWLSDNILLTDGHASFNKAHKVILKLNMIDSSK